MKEGWKMEVAWPSLQCAPPPHPCRKVGSWAHTRLSTQRHKGSQQRWPQHTPAQAAVPSRACTHAGISSNPAAQHTCQSGGAQPGHARTPGPQAAQRTCRTGGAGSWHRPHPSQRTRPGTEPWSAARKGGWSRVCWLNLNRVCWLRLRDLAHAQRQNPSAQHTHTHINTHVATASTHWQQTGEGPAASHPQRAWSTISSATCASGSGIEAKCLAESKNGTICLGRGLRGAAGKAWQRSTGALPC